MSEQLLPLLPISYLITSEANPNGRREIVIEIDSLHPAHPNR
jgi:hypothetical protein